MTRIDAITTTVKRAVEAVCSRRCSSDGFVDEYVRERAFVSTCEGLECILLPCIYFDRIALSELLEKFPELVECLQEDASYIISRSAPEKDKGRFSFPGDPYLGIGKRIGEENELPNLDSTALAVSAMLHLKALVQKEEVLQDEFPIVKMDRLIKGGLTQILDSHIENQGWPWGPGVQESNIYFTWSVLETLSDVFEYDPDGKLFDDYDSLRAAMAEAIKWVEEEWLPNMAEGKELGLKTKKLAPTYYYIESLIMLTLSGTSKYPEVADFLKHLLPFCDKIAKKKLEAQYIISGEPTTLPDYSIVPLLLRGISAAFLEFWEDEVFKEEIGINIKYKEIIQRRISDLDQKRTKEGLWAYDAKHFEWYYTERAIEALTMYHLYVHQHRRVKPTTKSFKKMKEELKEVEKNPVKEDG